MKITYLGHACFLLEGKKRILVDPFITGNPLSPINNNEVDADLILVTHAHADHVGDTREIAKRTGAKVIGMYDLAPIFPDVNYMGMNYGPTNVDGADIVMVPAWHSSSYNGKEYGNAAGFVIRDDVTVYHAGDTFVFGDMKLIGETYGIDVALLPIGGHFTMGPEEAAKAVELLGAKKVIPMHYNTFPPIRQDPEKFKALVGNAEVLILNPGESTEL